MCKLWVLPLLLGVAAASSDVATLLKGALTRPTTAKLKCQVQGHVLCEGAAKGLAGARVLVELYTPFEKRMTITKATFDIAQLAAQRKTYRNGAQTAVKLLSGPLKGMYAWKDAGTHAIILETERLYAKR